LISIGGGEKAHIRQWVTHYKLAIYVRMFFDEGGRGGKCEKGKRKEKKEALQHFANFGLLLTQVLIRGGRKTWEGGGGGGEKFLEKEGGKGEGGGRQGKATFSLG